MNVTTLVLCTILWVKSKNGRSDMKISVLFAMILLVGSIGCVNVRAINPSDLRHSLGDAYTAVSKAETNGGDVTFLVTRLNQAARLIDSGSKAT